MSNAAVWSESCGRLGYVSEAGADCDGAGKGSVGRAMNDFVDCLLK